MPYQVERLDWAGRKAFVTRTQVDYYTDAIDYTKLKVLSCFGSAPAGADSGAGSVHHGEVHVVRRVSGYKKIRYYTHENIGYGPVSLPDQELQTTAVWWQLPQSALDALFTSRQQALDAFMGAAHALHTIACLAVMADARDLRRSVGTGDEAWELGEHRHARSMPALAGVGERGVFLPTVHLYDNYPGGIGLSSPLFDRAAEIATGALELVTRCDCRAGCPACVGPALASDEQLVTETPKSLALRVLGVWASAA